MRKLGLVVKQKRRFVKTTDSNHNFKIAPNLLNRNFNPAAPNQVRTTDITYLKTQSGWVYLAIVLDLFSTQVVGWAIDDSMKTELCAQALTMAYWRRKPKKGLLHHSARGSQYASDDYQRLLSKYGMLCRMSRKGNCWDNAPTECFFRSPKQERKHGLALVNKYDAKLEVVDYVTCYNAKRLHASLDYVTPLDFEEQYYQNAA